MTLPGQSDMPLSEYLRRLTSTEEPMMAAEHRAFERRAGIARYEQSVLKAVTSAARRTGGAVRIGAPWDWFADRLVDDRFLTKDVDGRYRPTVLAEILDAVTL